MAIRGILFDKDGTIIDYWRTWVPINRKVALYAARGDRRSQMNSCASAVRTLKPTALLPGSPLAAGDYLRHCGGLCRPPWH